ncbi:MAG: WG repeat-containing protein [Sediminimonas qiaohouensis]|uniref:WG repeat-containing protein n=1 Tax=Sediminimonas qiaohouensis TaxID=552061 RepID=A0A7C9M787_9RHOB|nr:WG repeat-containing protein [Sediminimonas qiaohouensis]MTJ03501.1 WG repeat-containing protein [Sediminimonas qiaohouensis]
MTGRRTLTRILAAAGLTLASAAAALAQPCGTAAGTDNAPLYPLPHEAKWGFVGADGEWRLAPQWRQVRPFSEGVAAVETDAGWGLIDSTGAYIAEPGAHDADSVVIDGARYALSPYKPMAQGCSAATPADGDAHYITPTGERWRPEALSDEEVIDLGNFSEGLAWVRVARGKYSAVGWIDTSGEMVIAPDFTDGGDFVGGRAPAAINDENWGYIDTDGKLVFPGKFTLQDAGRYGDGLAPVRIGRESGFMDDTDWRFKSATYPDGQETEIRAAAPFHDARAAVQPGPVWINPQGRIAVNPQAGARHSICNEKRLPRYHDGLLPLVVGDGTNICGNAPDITYQGPGDPRSGPQRMLWALPWARDKLVWLDRSGTTVIDASACRRAPGIAALPTTTSGGALAEGAYRLRLSGMVAGETDPQRADAPCNRSAFEMDGNTATNEGGPWQLSLSGAARWQDRPVNLSLSLELPAGITAGQHPVKTPQDDNAVSAYLWLSVRDAGPNAPRPPSYASAGGGTLTLKRRDQAGLTGQVDMTLVSNENAQDTVDLSARFNAIPYTPGPEVALIETTGAVTALADSMPDDPLINFFTPASAQRDEGTLTLSLGKHGPKLELTLPADHSGAFTAGPDAPASIRFAGVPVTGEGELKHENGHLNGRVTASLAAHDQIDGEGSVMLRFAAVPIKADQ